MPVGGTATYKGNFVATAATSNWIDDTTTYPAMTLSANGAWSVWGTTTLKADFAAASVKGNLQPLEWLGWATLTGPAGYQSTNSADVNGNWKSFMGEAIIIDAKISKSKAVGAHPNTISGSANYDKTHNWLNNKDNQTSGSFFGTKADEIAGIFSVDASQPQPIGGQWANENPRRGYVTMVGGFSAKCDPASGGGSGVC